MEMLFDGWLLLIDEAAGAYGGTDGTADSAKDGESSKRTDGGRGSD